jgi:hypothetical protein
MVPYPALTHQTLTADLQNAKGVLPTAELVYFIRVGKFIKIGFTTNQQTLKGRLESFRGASAEPIQVLAVFPGNRKAERFLHDLFSDLRVLREFFREDYPLTEFLWHAKTISLSSALKWATDWKQEKERRRRQTPAERAMEQQKQYQERKRGTVSMYPEDWNEARLEANRRKQLARLREPTAPQ